MNSLNPTTPPPAQRPDRADALVLSPAAFLKLQFFLHAGATEVGGFGVSSQADLLYITDFVTVRQTASSVGVELESGAVADHLDAMIARGHTADESARIWIQTHAGTSATPSRSNERTFDQACGQSDWSLLFILARSGRTYARLQFRIGPKTRTILPVLVNWSAWSEALVASRAASAPQSSWMEEYVKNVRLEDDRTLEELKPAMTTAMIPSEVMPIRATRLLPTLIPIDPVPLD